MLHNKVPVKPAAVSFELPQELATEIVGVAGIAFTVSLTAAVVEEPWLFVHVARYCLLLSAVADVNV